MTMRTPNDTFVVPPEQGGGVDVPQNQEYRPLTPEELQKDRQALLEEASRYAISASGREGNTPIYDQTVQALEARRAAELSPEAKELQRISSSLKIMQDKHIDKLFSRQGLKDFSFSDISIVPSALVGRKPTDSEREKVRQKLIDQETQKSPKVFELDPDTNVPEGQVWQLQHVDGHFFWFIYDQTSRQSEPATIVHFSPTAKGAEKTVKFSDETENHHVSVSQSELRKLIQLFNRYENVMAQEIYFKVMGQHQA